jgi:hypothetical protein
MINAGDQIDAMLVCNFHVASWIEGGIIQAVDAARLTWMRTLINTGHADKIVISHDACQKTRLQSFGGHGYSHIYRNVIPMMHERDYTDREIETILVDNPRRLLTFAWHAPPLGSCGSTAATSQRDARFYFSPAAGRREI